MKIKTFEEELVWLAPAILPHGKYNFSLWKDSIIRFYLLLRGVTESEPYFMSVRSGIVVKEFVIQNLKEILADKALDDNEEYKQMVIDFIAKWEREPE